jgi:hypothetical protein
MPRSAAAVVLALLGLAAPAAGAGTGAGFEPLPLPLYAESLDDVYGFAASGRAWLAIVEGRAVLSTDEGATWRDAGVGGSSGFIALGPDGAFWLPFVSGREVTLARITADGAVTFVAAPPGVSSAPAWDRAGHMWLAGLNRRDSEDEIAAVRVDGAGAEQERVTAPAHDTGFPFIRFAGRDGFVAGAGEVFRLAGGKLKLISGHADSDAEFVQFNLWPVAEVGGAILTYRGLSLDGGETFGFTTRQQFGVYGNDGLVVRYPLVGQTLEGAVMARCRPWILCDTGIAVPPGSGELWRADAGLIAAPLDSGGPLGPIPGADRGFAIHRGGFPGFVVEGQGPAPSGARALIARLNGYRRAAGLHPLAFDPAMSRAALNHARYVVAHHLRLDNPRAHEERPGRAFTGVSPSARCKAEAVHCDSEDIIGGRGPVETLISSFYHRLVATAPFTQVGGAATYSGITVFAFDAARAALPLRPSGFPAGTYRGPLGLRNTEFPDPLDVCRPHLFTRNPSVPVTFEPPAREPSRPRNLTPEIREGPDVTIRSVSLFAGRKRVRGCGGGIGAFIAERPLRPHTRYTAKAVWRVSPRAPFRAFRWTFRTR